MFLGSGCLHFAKTKGQVEGRPLEVLWAPPLTRDVSAGSVILWIWDFCLKKITLGKKKLKSLIRANDASRQRSSKTNCSKVFQKILTLYTGQKFPGTQSGPKKSWFVFLSYEYSWWLKNVGLKCVCPFIRRFFFQQICITVLHHPRMVESTDVEGQR